MNREEAKAILQVWREEDTSVECPGLNEAMALLESDPVLKEWFENERDFDAEVSSALEAEVSIPSNLRGDILNAAEHHLTRSTNHSKPGRSKILQFSRLFPIAASLIIALGIGLMIFEPSRMEAEALDLSDFYNHASRTFQKDRKPEIQSTDFSEIQAYLRDSEAPLPSSIPTQLEALDLTGAATTDWRGLVLTEIYLGDEQGNEFRLFILEAEVFPRPEEIPGIPTAQTVEETEMLVWKEAELLYALGAPSSPEALARFAP